MGLWEIIKLNLNSIKIELKSKFESKKNYHAKKKRPTFSKKSATLHSGKISEKPEGMYTESGFYFYFLVFNYFEGLIKIG